MSEISAILSATELSVSYGHQVVLDKATLAIDEGERVGLLGRNGCGKSTFLRIAAGALEPDSGLIVTRRELVTGYLPQIFDLDEGETVHVNILSGARLVLDLIREYESVSADSAHSDKLLDRINHLDGWSIEHRIKSLCTNLNTPAPERVVGTLSGGEKRRVALCRALLARPDLLILDEPTNHLDTESIEWLEDFLKRYPGTCLFVTHDRYFLDRIATRIVELSNGAFVSHNGGYTDFLEAKAERQAVEEQQDRKRQKFLKRELEWVRRGPRARRTKSQDRVARYYEMAAEEGPEQELDVELVIPPAPKLANRVVALKDVAMEIDGRILFEGVDLELEAGSRVGIVGRNGLGKTTLLKIILGLVAPTRGTVEIGSRTQINYVDQGRLLLDDEKSVYQEVGEDGDHVRLGEETITVRAYLRRFLFTEERINTKVALLSGGERSRVILAKILKRGGNVIVLDEPTNDLDLATLRLLEEALAAFAGTVLVVSHDRYFLNRVCTNIIAFEGEGRVVQSVGNYDYYLEKRGAREPIVSKPSVPSAPAEMKSAPSSKARKLTWKETRELETIEDEILAAENEVARLDSVLADPEFYKTQGAQWHEIESQLKAARHKVAGRYARWEELEKIRSTSK